MRASGVVAVVGAVALCSANASAVTYQVGPTRALRELTAVAGMLNPGDVVEVDAGGTYAAVRFTRAGTVAMPITIRGMVGAVGARPVITGGDNTLELAGNNYVMENFEITGGARRCVFHHADNVVLRRSLVHDCARQGILGADQDSGDLTLEFVEVHHSGGGTQDHQIYMATDEVAYPGSVFRMQHCYVHDGNGGNAVKSRAERNEIYSNWIEGALYHELELIGPDPAGAAAGWTEALAREDSDVVGNVLRATNTFSIVRVGGDGTGQSRGRYRFVNNTFVSNAGGSAVMRVFDGIESIEMHNNAFFATGGTVTVSRVVEAQWVTGAAIFEGANNWVQSGATAVPAGFRGTIGGASPGFANAGTFDFRPVAGSPLVNGGVGATMSPAGRAFVRPLALPMFEPPRRTVAPAAIARASSGMIDVGAYEAAGAVVPDASTSDASLVDVVSAPDSSVADSGVATDSGVAVMDSGASVADAGTQPAVDSSVVPARDSSSSGDASTPTPMTGGCGCAVPSRGDRGAARWGTIVAVLALASARRRSAQRKAC
jgi:hypothetical protein